MMCRTVRAATAGSVSTHPTRGRSLLGATHNGSHHRAGGERTAGYAPRRAADVPLHGRRGQHPPVGDEPGADAVCPRTARRDHRSAIAGSGGEIVKTTGDGLMAVFAVPADAVTAAVAAQHGLFAETWPIGCAIRVRMGIHTGEVESRGGDFFGPAVNRTARIMSAGHGGQVLLSEATAGFVESAPGRRHVAGPRGASTEGPRAVAAALPACPSRAAGRVPLRCRRSTSGRTTFRPRHPRSWAAARSSEQLKPPRRPGCPAPSPDRPRWRRQDTARHPCRRRPDRPVHRWCLLRRPRDGDRQRRGSRPDRDRDRPRRRRGALTARRARRRRRAAGPDRPRQLRAGDRCRADDRRAARRLPGPEDARDEPPGAARAGRARGVGSAAVAVLRDAAAGASADDLSQFEAIQLFVERARGVGRTSGSPTTTLPRSPRSAAGSTGCPSPSSSRRPPQPLLARSAQGSARGQLQGARQRRPRPAGAPADASGRRSNGATSS